MVAVAAAAAVVCGAGGVGYCEILSHCVLPVLLEEVARSAL